MASMENRFVAARRKLIESDFSGLNDMQRQAVLATEGPLLLLAGAGSGKTTVLINRIGNLMKYGRASDSPELPGEISEADTALMERAAAGACSAEELERAKLMAALDPVEPWRILAITFTNKAAGELKARLETMLGDAAQDVWAMTFHAACVRILRRDCERLGFEKGFTIYDTSDSQSVMKRVLKDLDMDEKIYPHKAALSIISKAKDELIGPEEFLQQAIASGDVRRRRFGEAYVAYAKRLMAANAMDFDDLIYYAVRLLLDNEDVLSYYQRKFRYVLVDEYQDTNNLQYLLTSNLAGGYENICVVGDDDQSIYKFRGATIRNILSFEEQYKSARVIRLEQNYRSTGHILDAANAVIRNNVGRKGKNLWTEAPAGEKLTLYTASDEADEAQYVASRILESYGAGGAWSDNAVLYRMNAQSNQLEYAFKRAGIPYRIIGGIRFFDRAEIQDMLAYLCVISAPTDDLRMSRIINTPARGIGQTTVERLRELAAREGISLFEALRRADGDPEFAKGTVSRLTQFADLIDELRALSQQLPPDELYDEVIERSGYVRALQAKETDENVARIENVRELKTNIVQYVKTAEEPTLSGFLEEVALYTDLDSYDSGAESVVMMTMHSAKGLEFKSVYIVGMEEGIFPGQRVIGEAEEMEEERRLCYVAITRAKKKLYLCCARQRVLFGQTVSGKPSRFTEEIPEEHLERVGTAARRSSYGSGSFSADGWQRRSFTQPAVRRTVAAPSAPAKTAAPSFQTGDAVRHKAFGEGVIVKMTPMGGDHLVEIEFENVGLKRLMLRAAAAHMEKR